MKTIFEKLGYSVSETKTPLHTQQIKMLSINNPDGTTRWVWPAELKKPLFLKFYNLGNIRSGLFYLLIQLIFICRLQKLIFRHTSIFVKENSNELEVSQRFNKWALFTGTAGINRKAILYHEINGVGTFRKIATTDNAVKLLKNESQALNRLFASNVRNFCFPDIVKSTEGVIELSDISNDGVRLKQYTDLHTSALVELNEISSFLAPLHELSSWNELKSDLHVVKEKNDPRIPKGMIRKLEKLIEATNESLPIEISMSHGDFTPWNMFERDMKLHIYDWELSSPLRPLGFDAFHFIMQQGILVDRKNWIAIKKEIDLKIDSFTFSQLSKFNMSKREQYLELYLIFNCVNYLKIYSQQKNWHTQVNWLLQTWTEALNEFSVNHESQRELLLLDLFDFIQTKNYAAIKFPNLLPERLNKFSDVDLCIEKPLNKELKNYLSNHSLVNKTSSTISSFMANHQLICKDGSLLSLDLIWKIKRKDQVMLDAKTLLQRAYVNSFGIRCLDLLDNVRYIGLFYALNDCNIPVKYKVYDELLKKSDDLLDRHLLPFFIDDHRNNSLPVKKYLEQKTENTGFSALINKFNYTLDTLRSFLRFNGLIITFSGVDGAGKSTVIEKVKHRLEKQLRKRVIVIRHRPSLFPILSALTKGKEAAENESKNRLPRQGNNKSTLSSLARFSYYYLDYLIGQFVVYFKYVSRGYVVLYDRYYYDFINDSKRSNILLPASLIRAGFSLLMRPRFNFFLYAQPEVILARKKELDTKTIQELNHKYIELFHSLSAKNSKSHFESIENVELDVTLNTIFNNITKNAA
jgi:thymidylate kinase